MKCDKCGKKFKSKTSLIYHIDKNVCERKSKLNFECSECNKKFIGKKTLKIHMEKTTGRNTFASVDRSSVKLRYFIHNEFG